MSRGEDREIRCREVLELLPRPGLVPQLAVHIGKPRTPARDAGVLLDERRHALLELCQGGPPPCAARVSARRQSATALRFSASFPIASASCESCSTSEKRPSSRASVASIVATCQRLYGWRRRAREATARFELVVDSGDVAPLEQMREPPHPDLHRRADLACLLGQFE